MKFDKFFAWISILVIIIAVGLFAAYIRLTEGLSVTGMSDYYPWGFWITVDVLIGIALAAGAFIVGAVTYLLGNHKYEVISKPAILTGLIGYIIATLGLVLDIGFPERFWHTLVYPNLHSIMTENVLCITFYTLILLFEFSKVAADRYRWIPKIPGWVVIILVIAGALLSTLHQSGLGGVYIISPSRMDPLWYTRLIPPLFYTSAIAGGLSMVIFETVISSKVMNHNVDKDMLFNLGKITAIITGIFLLLRSFDVISRGLIEWSFTSPLAMQFWFSNALWVVSLVLLAIPFLRRSFPVLVVAALFTITGLITYRWDTVVTALYVPAGINYVPTWIEYAVTSGLLALGVLMFTIAVKLFPVFESHEHKYVSVSANTLNIRSISNNADKINDSIDNKINS